MLLLLLTSFLSFAEETRTLTVRCSDGILLIYGSPEHLNEIKQYLGDASLQKSVVLNDVMESLHDLPVFSRVTVESFYERQPVLPQAKKLFKLPLKDAVEGHLVPDILGVSLQEARQRLELFGFTVFLLSSKIGNSEIYAPCDISVQSAGKLAGSYTANLVNGYAWIFVNGKNVSKDSRGYNISVIDPSTCKVTASENFDTRDDQKGASNSMKMAQFINKIPDGKVVAAAVRDEGSKFLTPSAVSALKSIGAKKSLMGYRNYSHAVLGIKGFSEGQAMEDISPQVITLSVTKGLHTEDEIEKAFLQSSGASVFIRDTQEDSLIGVASAEKEK